MDMKVYEILHSVLLVLKYSNRVGAHGMLLAGMYLMGATGLYTVAGCEQRSTVFCLIKIMPFVHMLLRLWQKVININFF